MNSSFCLKLELEIKEDNIMIHLKGSKREDNFVWACTRIYIWLAFAHDVGGQCSCVCNLIRGHFRKKCEIYIVLGALAQAKRGHHSCIS